jgi:hypothetical protein
MTLLHRAADAALGGYPDLGLPKVFSAAVERYVAHARSFRPQGAHYLQHHRNICCSSGRTSGRSCRPT